MPYFQVPLAAATSKRKYLSFLHIWRSNSTRGVPKLLVIRIASPSRKNVTVLTTGDITQHNYHADDSIFSIRKLHRPILNKQYSADIADHFLGPMSHGGVISFFNRCAETQPNQDSQNYDNTKADCEHFYRPLLSENKKCIRKFKKFQLETSKFIAYSQLVRKFRGSEISVL